MDKNVLTEKQSQIVREAGEWYRKQSEYYEMELCRLFCFGQVDEDTPPALIYAAVLENMAEGLGKQFRKRAEYNAIRAMSIMG